MSRSKVCFITAIYGNYEASCKKYAKQTIAADFICFTDNPHIRTNGWILDTTPYHKTHMCPFDTGNYNNSLCKNTHTFNVAKYYKQQFSNIPRLRDYDVVVWLDGTVEIVDPGTSAYLLANIYTHKIIGWHHERRHGKLVHEVADSNFFRYTSIFRANQQQPYQDINKQYVDYVVDGYTDAFFSTMGSHTPHFGVWLTCFIAFLQHDKDVRGFLDMWYLQTLKYTTQDQIGFPYVCQKKCMVPLTLPNAEVWGDCPHDRTQFYIKHEHGM